MSLIFLNRSLPLYFGYHAIHLQLLVSVGYRDCGYLHVLDVHKGGLPYYRIRLI